MILDFFFNCAIGHLVAVSMFRKSSRDENGSYSRVCHLVEAYWLNKEGRMKGIFPCLEGGFHSFLHIFPESNERKATEYNGQETSFLYFHDGKGAICCAKLDS